MSQSEKSKADLRSIRVRDSRRAGALFISSGIIFVLLNTVAESIYPNYSVRVNAISDLGALGHSTTLLWDGQLFATGMLTLIATVILVFRSSLSEYLESTPIKLLYLLPPVGTLLVSIFPENSILVLHTLGAFFVFVFGAISTIYAYRFTKSPFRYFALLLGVISLVAIPFLGDSAPLGFGGMERLVVYPYAIWGIAFGAYLTAL